MIRLLSVLYFSILSLPAISQHDEKDAHESFSVLFSSFVKDSVKHISLIELEIYPTGKYIKRYFFSQKQQVYQNRSIIGKASIDTSRIRCYTDFPTDRWQELTAIFEQYNGEYSESACYEPRNGIVFYDDRNRINGYLEICFECHHIYWWGYSISTSLEGFSQEQYAQLRTLLLSAGMRYGVE